VEDELGHRYSIEWLEDTQSFCLYDTKTGYAPMDGSWLTVVGNIHDTPELLAGETAD
jgi:hypothetical protein